MTEFSLLMPFAPPRPEQVLSYAAFTQWSKAHRLWQGQAMMSDPHQSFTFAAASGFRMPVGMGVTLMPYRHPYTAALEAQTLAVTVGHPVVAGYGPGSVLVQRAMLGTTYRSPLRATRDYLTIMRSLLTTGSVDYQGEYFSCQADLVALPSPPVEVGVGVLRPAMARLAGEVADVAITWLTPAKYIRDVLVPALREGADAAGRPMPRLVAIVPVAVDAPGRDAAELVLASNSAHMRLPHYTDMLRRSGIDVDMTDPIASAHKMIAGGAFVSGEAKIVAEELTAFAEAGVDEIVLNTTGVYAKHGNQAALTEIETVLREVMP